MDRIKLLKSLGLYSWARGLLHWREKPGLLSFYSQFIGQGDLCFDVGASIGSRTEIFLQLGAKVVAIEPQDQPFRALIKRYGRNKNLVAINKGLASKEGTTQMFLCYADAVSSMSKEWISRVRAGGRFPSGYNWNEEATVQVTTLDALIASYGVPTFCKIDVEGYEYEVIQGLSQAVPMISFEHTPQVTETSLSVMTHIEKLGHYEYNYVRGEDAQFELEKWVDARAIVAYLSEFPDRQDIMSCDVYARLNPNLPRKDAM
jgi:FkbM family methyltransferase